ncbi:MAG: MSHA biogenesis protein MshP, partial [Candidatus Azotimanducaceae bacterium]
RSESRSESRPFSRPDSDFCNLRRRQAGMGLVGVIFLIVVVALLVLAMTRMLEVDSKIYSYEILSLKAFYAAESGAQLGANRVFPPTGVSTCSAHVFTFTDPAMSSCVATVSCDTVNVSGQVFYTLESVGLCSAGDVEARRTVQVRLKP